MTELREMGFEIDPDTLPRGDDMDELSVQRLARYSFDDTYEFGIWGRFGRGQR